MSKGATPDVPREFELVKDPGEALRFLKEGAKTLASTMIWTKNQEYVINTHLSVFSESGNSFYCWVPKGVDPRKFNEDMIEMDEKECLFSVSLSRANIFFKTKFLGYDPGGFQFKLPEKVFKVQRRKDLRYTIQDGTTMKVDFKDPLNPSDNLTKAVIDISAGGLSFLVDPADAPLYPTGLTLEGLSFSIRNKKITVKAEIRNSRPSREDARKKGVLVGVVFKDIRPGDSQHIAGFVFEESRKYFSRFI